MECTWAVRAAENMAGVATPDPRSVHHVVDSESRIVYAVTPCVSPVCDVDECLLDGRMFPMAAQRACSVFCVGSEDEADAPSWTTVLQESLAEICHYRLWLDDVDVAGRV